MIKVLLVLTFIVLSNLNIEAQVKNPTAEFLKLDKQQAFCGIKFGQSYDSLVTYLGLKAHANREDNNFKSYLISNDSVIKLDTFKYFMQSAFFLNNKLSSVYLYSIDFTKMDNFKLLSSYLQKLYGIPFTSKEGHHLWEGKNMLVKLFDTMKTGDTTLGSALLIIELRPELKKRL